MASRKILRALDILVGVQTREFERGFGKIDRRLSGFQKNVNRAGKALVGLFAASELAAGIGSAIRKIAAFEEQMSKVRAISGATQKEFDALTKNALDLGAATKFTASEIGAMQESLARLGFTTPQIIASTDAIRKLATAAGEELNTSAEVLAGTLKSFNLEATESERVANVMAESFAGSALNLEKFGVAMSNVGAQANAAGVTLEQTTALLGMLVDRNIDASKAGTDLRRIFSNLSTSGLSFNDAMDRIQNSTNQVATAVDLFGARAQTSAIIIANNRDQFEKFTMSLGDTNTELDNMVSIMEDNLATDLKLLESAIDGLIQKGGALNNVFRGVVQGLTSIVNNIPQVKVGLFDLLNPLTAIAKLGVLGLSSGGGPGTEGPIGPPTAPNIPGPPTGQGVFGDSLPQAEEIEKVTNKVKEGIPVWEDWSKKIADLTIKSKDMKVGIGLEDDELPKFLDKMSMGIQGVTSEIERMGDEFVRMAAVGRVSFDSLASDLFNFVRKSVQARLVEATAAVLADSFKKFGLAGAFIAPIGAGLVAAAFNELVPTLGGGSGGQSTIPQLSRAGDVIPNQVQTINVNVTGRIAGQDILLAVDEAERQEGVVRGNG